MLYTSAIPSGTLSLLKNLMAIDELSEFNLAGGTALALHIGHRISYDLDFFGHTDIDLTEVLELLRPGYPLQEMHRTQNILALDINGVKVDFVKYAYPLIGVPQELEEIRLISIEDIAAMKLDAIKGRGRKRDFYDVYFLLKKFDLPSLLEFHLKKYGQDTRFLILKSMVYFDDAENDVPVQLLHEEISWEEVKTVITRQVKNI